MGGVIDLRPRWLQAVRYATGLICLALIFVTLAPASYRPSLTDDPQFDRFMAFSLVGAFLSAAIPRRLAVVAGLCVAVVVLEAGQHFIPGRHAQVADIVIKIAGSLTGVGVAWLLQWSLRSRPIRLATSWAAIVIGVAVMSVVSLAAWYVVSPERALENLRVVLASQRDCTPFPNADLLYQPVPGLKNPLIRRVIIGDPSKRLTTDIWGRSISQFRITVRTQDRTVVLLVFRFRRAGLHWLLESISPPDGVAVPSSTS